MNLREIKRELIARKLYEVFHVKEEDYIVTVKLLYIYDNVQQVTTDPINYIRRMRIEFIRRSRRQTIDALYNDIQHSMFILNRRYAPPTAKAPQGTDQFQPGWNIR